jgi:hypothetical protein
MPDLAKHEKFALSSGNNVSGLDSITKYSGGYRDDKNISLVSFCIAGSSIGSDQRV